MTNSKDFKWGIMSYCDVFSSDGSKTVIIPQKGNHIPDNAYKIKKLPTDSNICYAYNKESILICRIKKDEHGFTILEPTTKVEPIDPNLPGTALRTSDVNTV